jgi:hypothetical protein
MSLLTCTAQPPPRRCGPCLQVNRLRSEYSPKTSAAPQHKTSTAPCLQATFVNKAQQKRNGTLRPLSCRCERSPARRHLPKATRGRVTGCNKDSSIAAKTSAGPIAFREQNVRPGGNEGPQLRGHGGQGSPGGAGGGGGLLGGQLRGPVHTASKRRSPPPPHRYHLLQSRGQPRAQVPRHVMRHAPIRSLVGGG